MQVAWETAITRRGLLRIGLTGAALAAIPWPFGGRVAAASPDPHLLITLIADGGWDTTQVLDAHDPADATDGIDVDVPGQPASLIASAGGLSYVSNPATRAAVDTFFANWAGKTAIVNGIGTRSTSHDQSRQLVLTGYLDPTRADFAVMAAHHNGPDLPLPHLLISGDSFAGKFAGLSGRVGGAFGAAINYNRLPDSSQRVASAAGERLIREALERERTLAASSAIADKLEQFHEASDRGDRLASLASTLPRSGNAAQLATSLGGAFRAGMTTSVTVSVTGGFDTHSDNTQQNDRWQQLFTFLDALVAGLAAQAGVVSTSLLDETTIVCCSEFGRTPRLNENNGKDHHPWTSMLLIGKRVRPGVTVGMTDANQEGVPVDLASGQPDAAGQVIDVQNMVAGILTLVGANSSDYLPGIRPFTAMVAA
jgi:uncharacterized protein (DUF1501 family)